MLSNIQRSIIIRALQIRQQNGEDLAVAVKDYTRLTADEQAEILAIVRGGEANG